MRLCLVATTGLEDMITVVGSEPYLAEAARMIISGAGANPIRCLVENSDLNLRRCLPHSSSCRPAMMASSATKRRWVFITDFMKALLPASAYDELKKSLPSLFHPNEDKPSESAFKGYCQWFNHVIKIGVDPLWEFITQGAMILSINNQRGVDIVLPICVKNDKSYQYDISQFLLFPKDHTPLPVIRMVFALVSSEAGVSIPAAPQRGHH
ncbi:hypothetical protein B0F90DRAFT_1772875 [Multifurca ochricompacta]|uniref:Uncharacterized protein n=1 Tax=Multifurca ochricompacta TaxID=376703 RepID=A0AAD4QFJ8_9AGAM|nr:hypothetical protein B0F90DRAFT_1772875 [Multifurca ochricompacta]